MCRKLLSLMLQALDLQQWPRLLFGYLLGSSTDGYTNLASCMDIIPTWQASECMHTVPMLISVLVLILWIGGSFGAFSDLLTTHDTRLLCGCNHYGNVATA